MTNADFLNAPIPPATALDAFDPTTPARFFNRELSWLAFNWRVLEEAENPNVPLLERVRFLSISGSNLDEFYTVRVAGLRGLVREGVTRPSADGLSPSEQLRASDAGARALMQRQQSCWNTLLGEMRGAGIHILRPNDLTKQDRAELEDVFIEQVFPILTPLAIDPAHPFPFISNLSLNLALFVRSPEGEQRLARVKVPAMLPRLVSVEKPGKPVTGPGRIRVVLRNIYFVLRLILRFAPKWIANIIEL